MFQYLQNTCSKYLFFLWNGKLMRLDGWCGQYRGGASVLLVFVSKVCSFPFVLIHIHEAHWHWYWPKATPKEWKSRLDLISHIALIVLYEGKGRTVDITHSNSDNGPAGKFWMAWRKVLNRPAGVIVAGEYPISTSCWSPSHHEILCKHSFFTISHFSLTFYSGFQFLTIYP